MFGNTKNTNKFCLNIKFTLNLQPVLKNITVMIPKLSMVESVKQFHETYNCPFYNKPQDPRHIQPERVDLRISLMQEELKETVEAMNHDNQKEIADGLCDLMYVVIGTAWEYGLGSCLEEMFAEVHRSNMSKLDPETGKAMFRDDGKVLKGSNFSKPDLMRIIKNKTIG